MKNLLMNKKNYNRMIKMLKKMIKMKCKYFKKNKLNQVKKNKKLRLNLKNFWLNLMLKRKNQ